jgi:multidrug efflux system outer membrane protein
MTLVLLLAGGCATLAPERQLPAVPVAGDWNATGRPGAEIDLTGWRDAFPDPALQQLIETALRENRTLKAGRAGHGQGRAQYGITRPTGCRTWTPPGATQYPPALGLRGGISGIDRQWAAGLGVTAFELDFFGRVRSLEEAALQEYLATEEARRAAHIALVAEVARTYLTLAGDREPWPWPGYPAEPSGTLELTLARIASGMGTDLGATRPRRPWP